MKLAFGIVSTLFFFTTITGASAAGLPGKYPVAGKNADGSSY